MTKSQVWRVISCNSLKVAQLLFRIQQCSILCNFVAKMQWTLIGQFLFMRQSCSVRHAQSHTATMSCDKVARRNRAIELQVWHQSNSIPRSFLHQLLWHRATGKKWHRFLMGLHVTNQQWRKLKAFIQPKARLSFFIHHWTPEGMLLNSCCLPNTSTNVNSRLILKVMQTCYNTQWWNFKSELCVKGLRYDTVD